MMIRLASNYLAIGGITYALLLWLVKDGQRAAELAAVAVLAMAVYGISNGDKP